MHSNEYLTLVVADDQKTVRDDKDTAPGRLLDLMVLVLAIDAFDSVGGNPPFLDKGVALYRHHRGSLEEAAQKHLESLMDRSDAGAIEAKYRLIQQMDPTKKARFIEEFMVWIKHRTSLMRDVFPGRVYTNACKVAVACDETDLISRMQRLAVVPTSSGLSAMFKWVRKAAEMLGAPAPTVELVAAQVESVEAIAEEMKEADRKLSLEPHGSGARAQLQDRKLDLAADLNEAVEESDDPATVGAAAASKYAAPSPVAQQFGLTPEQEDIMRSMGKVVIAAGAGSGKTQTLVATIAHLVREKGYTPGQIMACSFTVAASTELDGRVTDRAGIQGCNIGTTHRFARDIIKRHRPDLAEVVGRTKNADKLFKIAMKQVPLSMGAYQEGKERAKKNLEKIESIYGWRSIQILSSFHDQIMRGRMLSEKQQSVLDNWRSYPSRRRYAEEESPSVSAVKAVMAQEPGHGMAVEASEFGEDVISPYWTTPVGQWFNIGKPIVDEQGKPMGEKTARLRVENFKNSGQTVDQVRSDRGDNDPIAALFGAYEWLKQNDKALGPAMDYTDQLVVALQILKDDPKARASEQRRYKAILVDEAQDLNGVQFEMFQILGEKADLLGFIGDDKQCLEKSSIISTALGGIPLSEVREGTRITSYLNGGLAEQVVRHVVPSNWTWGFKVSLASGHSLTMSPNHRLWATEPLLDGTEVLVYLMYRPDMGYRVGVTNKGGRTKKGGDSYYSTFGGRAFLEKAERLWVLGVYPSRYEARVAELSYSLTYSIPTCVFNGEHRGLDQRYLDTIFEKFGENGKKLLAEKNLSFDYPHWISQGYTKHARDRRVVNLLAHSPQGTQVWLEWSDPEVDTKLEGLPSGRRGFLFEVLPDGHRRFRRYLPSYRKALQLAEDLAKRTGSIIQHRLSTPEGALREVTASGLLIGMKVPVLDAEVGGLVLESITGIERVEGEFIDLDVDDASNFFGGGILSHNSIYGFRGAKPQNYVNLSKKEGYATKLMRMNFRSGKAIVDAANKLIAHNMDRQIPMVCEADEERKGLGSIRAKDAETHEDAADMVAQEIKDAVDSGESLNGSNGHPNFGILVRNNAEHDAYTLALLVRGIPYRLLKRGDNGYFGKPLVRALTAWMRLVVGGSQDLINDAVIDAHMTPGFGLDKQFVAGLSRNAKGESYLDYILAGKSVYTGKAEWMNKRVAEYANTIRDIMVSSGMDSPSLIRAILSIKGLKETFEQSLMRLVDEDDLIEQEGGEVSEEAIRNAAMAPLRPLVIMADNFKDPGNLLTFIQKMKAANEKAQKKSPDDKEDWKEPAVMVGTVHGWKGLQATHCYVCMAGGVFPNFRSEEKAVEDETAFDEERRLAYVAITRGEQSVTILSPHKNYLGKPATLSRFVSEACIPLVGEKLPDVPVGSNEEELALASPKQELALPMSNVAASFKGARVGSFQSSMASFGHGLNDCGSLVGCEGCEDGCEGECKEGEGCKAEDGSCSCEYDYAR